MSEDSGDPTRQGDHGHVGGAAGKRLGDFELLGELGRGGMGVVYKARQLSLDRLVALKVLPPGLGLSGTAVQRFEREARAAAKLHHTNIVPVHAIGEEEGSHYYAMELIEGLSLAQILEDVQREETHTFREETLTRMFEPHAEQPEPSAIDRTPSSTSRSGTSATDRKWFDTVARQLADVADALSHAHDRGIIHRDIKPANLLLSPEGRLCITDFGLARVAQEPGMTSTGALLGTPSYMSPEQARGQNIDHRSDIYSLGVVLYEMLTLQRPFLGVSWEKIVHAILTRDPAAPRRVNPRVPIDLETICLKAMEKDPDRRYQDAEALANDLRQYLQRGLIAARRASLARRAWKSARRHPVATVSVLAIVVVIAVAGFSWNAMRKADLPRLVSDARLQLTQGDLRGALEIAGRALELDPDNSDAHLIRARVYISSAHFWDAVREARAVLELNPDNWEAHLLIAGAGIKGDLYSIPVEEHLEAVEGRVPDTAEAYFLRGFAAAYTANWTRNQEAIDLLSRALELNPGHALALEARSDVHSSRKDFPAALADAERLIAARPHSVKAYSQKAHLLLKVHDHHGAMDSANRAIELDPENAMGYGSRSEVNGAMDRREEQIADLTRAIELDPSEWHYHDRANVHYQIGEYDLGIADLEKSLEIYPDYGYAYGSMMHMLHDAGRGDEVGAVMDRLTARAENWVWEEARSKVHDLKFQYFWGSGDLDKASAELELAKGSAHFASEDLDYYYFRASIEKQRGNSAAFTETCKIMAALEVVELAELVLRANGMSYVCGRSDQALADWNAVLELAPNWADGYMFRAWVLMSVSSYGEAIRDLNRAIELAPAWSRPLIYRGQSLAALERFDEALTDYVRAAELGYDTSHLLLNKANALLRLNREEEALEALDGAVEREPKNANAHAGRGNILFQLGRLDEAIEAYTSAIDAMPMSGRAYANRGWIISHKADGCQGAAADLEKASELYPGDEQVLHRWAWVIALSSATNCPQLSDLEQAAEFSSRANEINPANINYRTGLGLVLYRQQRFLESRDALLKALELSSQPEPETLFVLAMVDWQLGREAEARSYYERAVARMRATFPKNPDYIRLRDEAARLLGVV